ERDESVLPAPGPEAHAAAGRSRPDRGPDDAAEGARNLPPVDVEGVERGVDRVEVRFETHSALDGAPLDRRPGFLPDRRERARLPIRGRPAVADRLDPAVAVEHVDEIAARPEDRAHALLLRHDPRRAEPVG